MKLLKNSLKIILIFFLMGISLDGIGQTTVTLNNGTTGNMTTGSLGTADHGLIPIQTNYYKQKSQYLVRGSELSASLAGNIVSLAINVSVQPGRDMAGFTIKMKHTSSTVLNRTFEQSLQTVYSITSQTKASLTTGWQTFTFSSPFSWDGTSNVLIEFCWDNGSNYSNAGGVYYHVPFGADKVSRYFETDGSANTACGYPASPTSTRTDPWRPQFRFVINPSCTSATLFSVTGGGSYCAGTSGIAVGLSGSQTGVNYQLKRGGTNVGSAIAGTGSAISFGNQTSAGNYTVVASGTGYCLTTTMTGSKDVSIKAAPTSVTAGSAPAAFCSGSASLNGGAVGVNDVVYYINESFSGSGIPTDWTSTIQTVSSRKGTIAITSSNNAGGSANEITIGTGNTASGTNYTARLSYGSINTTGKTSLSLNFKTWLRRFSTTGSITASVQTSTDGTNWTNTTWVKTISDPAYIGNETITLGTSNGVGSSTLYVAFFVTGRLYYLTGASFDDVVLSTTDVLPVTYSWSGGPFVSGQNTATPVVNPASTTTYTMTATSGGCSVTSDVLVTVTPVTAGTASTNQTICVGSTPSALSLSGNSGTIQWQSSTDNSSFTDISGETSATLASSVMGALAATKYFRAKVTSGSCSGNSNAVTITVPTAGTSLANDGDEATCRVKDGNWVHFYKSGRLLVSLSCADDLGDVTVKSYVESAPLTVAACDDSNPASATAVLGRHWLISRDAITYPITNPISVRLPFSSTEDDALESLANGNTNPTDNLSAITDVKLSKYAGPSNVDGNAANNCVSAGGSGNTQIFTQNGAGSVSDYATGFPATGKYVQYSIPGFSEFWLHGSSNNSPLPIDLKSFDVKCDNSNRIFIQWTTLDEVNTDVFVVQKSYDAFHWFDFKEVKAAGNSAYELDYLVNDSDDFNGVLYYRLVNKDFSGEEKTHSPKALSCKGSSNFVLFPNPSNGLLKVHIPAKYEGEKLTYSIFNLEGKVLSPDMQCNGTLLEIDMTTFNSGMYFLEIRKDDSSIEVLKFSIK